MKRERTKNETDVRIIASFVILVGAVVIGNWPKSQEEQSPIKIQTVGAAISDCNSRSIQTSSRRLGCVNIKGVRSNGSVRILSVGKRN